MAGPAICGGKQFLMQHFSFLLLILQLPGCVSPLLERCGGSFDGSGTIHTPNYPYTYPSNMHCVWNLTAKHGNVIFIQFVAIEIDVNGDLLLIYNGSTSVMNLTGFHAPFNLTLGPRVTLKFTSDESVVNLGFELRWMTGISCQLGYEYFDGHNCMPCTGASNYLSRKVRNCSLDQDAEYAEKYSPPQQDVVDEAVPSTTVLKKPDHTETTDLWKWLGLVIGVFVLAIISAIVTYRVYIKRCKKSYRHVPSVHNEVQEEQ